MTILQPHSFNGIDVTLIRCTPMRTDEENVSMPKVFTAGSMSIYSKNTLSFDSPAVFDRWLDHPSR
jgi:hypothetical protein